MGFYMEFDAKHNILRFTLEGEVTDAHLRDAYANAAKQIAARGPSPGIWDMSRVTKSQISADTIRDLANKPPVIPRGFMRIIVAPKDAHYGMMRMFQILGETTRPDMQVVRTLQEAYDLLQIDSPEFGAID